MFLTPAQPEPSTWVRRFAGLVRPGGTVLDLACGSGRHLRWLVEHGYAVTGVDRDEKAVAPLREHAEIIVADIEAAAWPLGDRQFDGIVVTNYLWRSLWPALRGALAGGGILIYETFAHGQQTIGKPSRPEFLLQSGELWSACAGLRVVAFEDGFEPNPTRFVQRIVAVNQEPQGHLPARYSLAGPAG